MVHILKKIRVNYSIVKKIKQYLHEESLLILYHSLFRSHIDNCIEIWCHGNKVMVDKLQRSMNKFVRMMFGLSKRDGVSEILKSHNVMSIKQLQFREIAVLMFKLSTNSLPRPFLSMFQNIKLKFQNNFPMKTRSNSNLVSKFCKLSTTRQSLKYKGPVIWNKLPASLKKTRSLKSFVTHEFILTKL